MSDDLANGCDCPELDSDLEIYGEHFHFDGRRIDPMKAIALRALSEQLNRKYPGTM